MKNPLVTVIIPAFNEEDVIGRLLKSIEKQSFHKIETIVIDDASTDNTAKIAKKYTDKVFTRKHAERSVQRNFGAKKAKGKFLLVLDADMELGKTVVKECVDKMQGNKDVGALVIPEISVATTFWERVKAYERSFYNLEGDSNIEAARFFRKKVFDEVGGYDEKITGPEDWDLPERIEKQGYKIKRINSKLKHYERVPNPFKLAQKKYYYGLKSHRYLKKHNISAVSTKTIYFLRPVFYKNWKRLLLHPLMSISMFVMLTMEQLGGGLGYLKGKYSNV